MQLAVKPGAGPDPVPLCRRSRDAECLGRLLQAAAGEEAQLDHLGLLRVGALAPAMRASVPSTARANRSAQRAEDRNTDGLCYRKRRRSSLLHSWS